MEEVPHSVRGHSCSFSARVYSQSECHPYNYRTRTAVYITMVQNDYGFWGCM